MLVSHALYGRTQRWTEDSRYVEEIDGDDVRLVSRPAFRLAVVARVVDFRGSVRPCPRVILVSCVPSRQRALLPPLLALPCAAPCS